MFREAYKIMVMGASEQVIDWRLYVYILYHLVFMGQIPGVELDYLVDYGPNLLY